MTIDINKDSNFISAVVYLSDGNLVCLEKFLWILNSYLTQKFKDYEIVIVNDGLTIDNKSLNKVIDELNSSNHCIIVNLSRRHGVELAMIAGVDMAIGDYIFEIDKISGDYSTELFDKAYKACIEGHDIVSVYSKKATDIYSKLFMNIYNRSSDGDEIHSDLFRCVTRRAVNRMKSVANSTRYRKLQYARTGLDSLSIPCDLVIKSKDDTHHFAEKTDLALDGFILFTDVIARVISAITIAFLIFSFAVGVYVIVCYVVSKPVEGWTPMMGFLSVGFTGVFGVLTMILKYLILITKMIFIKRDYLVRSVERM